MPGASWTNPNFETQDGTSYKTAIDNCLQLTERIARGFSPREKDTPDMQVRVDTGYRFSATSGSFTAINAQNSPTFVAPVTDTRIDRLQITTAGSLSIVKGEGDGSQTVNDLTAECYPICQVALTVGCTEITNSMITDERVAGNLLLDISGGGGTRGSESFTSTSSWTCPDDITTVWATGIAAGGGGAGCDASKPSGGGGGQGGLTIRSSCTVTPTYVYSIGIGGGGAGGAAGLNGQAGGGCWMRSPGSGPYLVNLSGGLYGGAGNHMSVALASATTLYIGGDGYGSYFGQGGQGGIGSSLGSVTNGGNAGSYGAGGGGAAGDGNGTGGNGSAPILILDW